MEDSDRYFNTVHPDLGYQAVDYDSTGHGLNADDSNYPESGYIKCRKCGFTFNKHRWLKGHEEGNTQHETQLNGAVTVGDAIINVDSTVGFASSGYIYIYDTDIVSSTIGHRVNKVTYAGTSSTTFTGCTNVKAHADGMYVRDERVSSSGCPKCGTYIYE